MDTPEKKQWQILSQKGNLTTYGNWFHNYRGSKLIDSDDIHSYKSNVLYNWDHDGPYTHYKIDWLLDV